MSGHLWLLAWVTQAYRMALERVCHALQVALEGIEVEHQRGRVDGV